MSAFVGGQDVLLPPVQAPELQVCPVLHTLPQAPQLLASVLVLTHVEPHSV